MRKFKLINGSGWDKSFIEGKIYSQTEKDYLGNTVMDLLTIFPQDWQEVLENQSPWISVSDRLPKKNKRILVYFPLFSSSPMDGLFDGKNFFVDSILRTDSVTHWMPLPEPPVK